MDFHSTTDKTSLGRFLLWRPAYSLSVPEKVVAQMAELNKEATGLRDVVKREADEKLTIIRSIERIQSIVKADIKLSDQAMAGFKGFHEGHLDQDARLSLLRVGGERVSKALDSLDGEEFLSVMRECTPKLLELLAAKESEHVETKSIEVYHEATHLETRLAVARPEEMITEQPRHIETRQVEVRPIEIVHEETRRVETKPPSLSFRISLEGGRLAIFDWRSYHLSIKNEGGDLKDARVSAMLPPLLHRYKPLELGSGAEANLDLKRFHRLARAESIKAEVRCKDADMREYRGALEVELEGKAWQKLTLQEAPPQAAPGNGRPKQKDR